MTGRRTVLGLCMFCALAISAVAAQVASAANTALFTCAANPSGAFWGAHCLSTNNGAAKFEHVEFSGSTAITGTNANTANGTTAAEPSILKEVIAGTELELKATGVSGSGSIENTGAASKGSGTITYSGVEVVKPAGKGCKVFTDETATKTKGAEGVIDAEVKATTEGTEDFVKFEPAVGNAFATFFVECTTKVEALEGTWEITGSIKCPVNGATILCSHSEITTQNTLKGEGNKAGLAGAGTLIGPNGNAFVTTTR